VIKCENGQGATALFTSFNAKFIMDVADTQALITGAVTDYGTAVLAILGSVLTIGVAYLAFRFGWRKVKGSTR
jgi:hypothetical protein